MSSNPDRPSLAVVAAGGFGVLVVLAFVVGLALADLSTPSLGERVRLVRGPVVLVGRCLDQRVTSVTVAHGATTLWRFSDAKGSIDRRYEVTPGVGGDGPVTVRVTFDHGDDAVAAADLASLPADPGPPSGTPPPCPGHRGLSPATVLFVVAAAVVVGGYGVMVARMFGGFGS